MNRLLRPTAVPDVNPTEHWAAKCGQNKSVRIHLFKDDNTKTNPERKRRVIN